MRKVTIVKAEVKKGTAPVSEQPIERPLPDHCGRGVQHCRVKIALHCPVMAHPLPGIVERNPPVDAHDLPAGFAQQRQQRGIARQEIDDRCVVRELRNQRLHVWYYVTAVITWRKTARPTVEDLHRLTARIDLGLKVNHEAAGQPSHQVIPDVRMPIHQRFCFDVVA